jgi:hypothetical protein
MGASSPPPGAGAMAAPAAAAGATLSLVPMSSFGGLPPLAEFWLAQPVNSRAAVARQSVARVGVEVACTGFLLAGLFELSAVRRGSAVCGSIGSLTLGSGDRAAALEEEDVAPPAVVFADVFADADDPESAACVEPEAGLILWEYPALQRPNAGRFS